MGAAHKTFSEFIDGMLFLNSYTLYKSVDIRVIHSRQ